MTKGPGQSRPLHFGKATSGDYSNADLDMLSLRWETEQAGGLSQEDERTLS